MAYTVCDSTCMFCKDHPSILYFLVKIKIHTCGIFLQVLFQVHKMNRQTDDGHKMSVLKSGTNCLLPTDN